jgi:hypothetical protein
MSSTEEKSLLDNPLDPLVEKCRIAQPVRFGI